jgi:hypothetical protein
MEYAIGKLSHVNASGLKFITLLKCTQDNVGRSWANDQNVRPDELYLVKFEPADQFCYVVPLEEVGEALELAAAEHLDPART